MAALAGALLAGGRISGRRTAGRKIKWAPDRTVFFGLLARIMNARIARPAFAPRGREGTGAGLAVATAQLLATSLWRGARAPYATSDRHAADLSGTP